MYENQIAEFEQSTSNDSPLAAQCVALHPDYPPTNGPIVRCVKNQGHHFAHEGRVDSQVTAWTDLNTPKRGPDRRQRDRRTAETRVHYAGEAVLAAARMVAHDAEGGALETLRSAVSAWEAAIDARREGMTR